ncbi:MAG: type I restriction endonuclease [Candidatus Omnitrophota bacterium]
MEIPSFREDQISQVPALQMLFNLGHTYLRPEDVLIARGRKTSNVILESVLEKQLHQINAIFCKGSEYKFLNNNIRSAITTLKNVPYDGLIRTNEKIYDSHKTSIPFLITDCINRITQHFIPDIMEINANTTGVIAEMLFKDVKILRIDKTFTHPSLRTNFLENDVAKLEKLFGQGKTTFGEFEQRFEGIIK